MLSLETTQAQSSSFKTKVAAAVAATAAVGAVAAITLSSTSSVARQTTGLFNIPEDIKGHFSGGELTGEWTVQGKFHKFETTSGDWQIDSKLTVEGPAIEGSETYTLVDNVLVMVPVYKEMPEAKMECGGRDNLPAYTKWAGILDSAQAIPEKKMSRAFKNAVKENCPTGASSVLIKVDDRDYVICADSTANTRAMYAFNADHSFSAVSREGMTVNIEHPKGWEALNCTTFDASKTREEAAGLIGKLADDGDRDLKGFAVKSAKPVSVKPGSKSIGEGGFTVGSTDKDRVFFYEREFNSATQREKDGIVMEAHQETMDEMFAINDATAPFDPVAGLIGDTAPEPIPPIGRNCAFFHGVGADGTAGEGLKQEVADYWNHEQHLARYCANTNKFIYTDSQQRGYNNLDYHTEICDCLASSDFADPDASIMFTHSMGGLTTRRALADEVCQWSGRYYMSQAPMAGSKAAEFAQTFCVLSAYFHLVGALLRIGPLSGYCRPFPGSWPAYHTIFRDVPFFGNAGKRADGRLCGSNPFGQGGSLGWALRTIQYLSGLQRRNDWCMLPKISCGWRGCRTTGCHLWYRCPYNDGMVSWDACGRWWTASSTRIDRMGMNHADGTGRTGSRATGASVKKWFGSKVKYGAIQEGGGTGGTNGAGAPGNGWGHHDEVEGPVDGSGAHQN
jgi:hypothetical protein